MDVIFPVAGLGSRLRPLTWSKPKPLVQVAGKAMFEHVMDRVLPYEPEKIVFITGYLGDEIEAWAREKYPDQALAFVEQPEMLGQTDAIIRTRGICSDDALIIFPDAIFEADFSILAESDGDGIIFTKIVEDPSALGVTVVEDGFITRLIEKPADPVSFEATVGLYYFRSILDLYDAIDEQMKLGIKTKNEYFIADAIQIMIDRGAKFRTSNIDVFEDCGNPDALLHTNEYLLKLNPPSPAQRPASVIIPPSFVDPSALVEHAVVGPNVSIGANAVIRDSVVRDAIVEPGSNLVGVVVEHAVIGRNASITGKPKEFNLADNSKVQV